jgi:hypothetical protein
MKKLTKDEFEIVDHYVQLANVNITHAIEYLSWKPGFTSDDYAQIFDFCADLINIEHQLERLHRRLPALNQSSREVKP